jgi:hypothetical protein
MKSPGDGPTMIQWARVAFGSVGCTRNDAGATLMAQAVQEGSNRGGSAEIRLKTPRNI